MTFVFFLNLFCLKRRSDKCYLQLLIYQLTRKRKYSLLILKEYFLQLLGALLRVCDLLGEKILLVLCVLLKEFPCCLCSRGIGFSVFLRFLIPFLNKDFLLKIELLLSTVTNYFFDFLILI